MARLVVDEPAADRYALLAANLEVLASPTRLMLLRALRTPQSVGEIRVGATQVREGERAERAISRQAVTRHIERLRAMGLIRRVESGDANDGGFVLDHGRLFATIEQIRDLAKLRPAAAVPLARTVDAEAIRGEWSVPRPRLVVAHGRDDGAAFPLPAAPGSAVAIGRGARCDVRLDYDPYLSTEHASLTRTTDAFVLRDLGSRNGTSVDGVTLPSGAAMALRGGELIRLGRSVLAYQSS